jgi:hypothetical protein
MANGEQPFRKAIDSTVMLAIARFLMPAVVAVLGYFLSSTLDDLKRANQNVWQQVNKMADAQVQTNIMQSGLSVKVDNAVKQLDHLQLQVDGLPRR